MLPCLASLSIYTAGPVVGNLVLQGDSPVRPKGQCTFLQTKLMNWFIETLLSLSFFQCDCLSFSTYCMQLNNYVVTELCLIKWIWFIDLFKKKRLFLLKLTRMTRYFSKGNTYIETTVYFIEGFYCIPWITYISANIIEHLMQDLLNGFCYYNMCVVQYQIWCYVSSLRYMCCIMLQWVVNLQLLPECLFH